MKRVPPVTPLHPWGVAVSTVAESSLGLRWAISRFKHVKSAPYHPASNGLAEQSFKQSLKASHNDGRSLSQRLSSYLLLYRTTVHTTTGVPPCKLFLQCDLQTKFTLLQPDTLRKLYGISKPQRSLHMTAMLELVSGLWENEFWFEFSVLALIGFLASLLRCWGLSPTLLRQMRVRDGNDMLTDQELDCPCSSG